MNGPESVGQGGVLEELTLPEVVEIWVESEIDRRLREVESHHADIIRGALACDHLQVMPLRGGFHDDRARVEVLVEVRDRIQRLSRIGAWEEKKSDRRDEDAFRRAYEKAMAHAIIQLLPPVIWRPWIRAAARTG